MKTTYYGDSHLASYLASILLPLALGLRLLVSKGSQSARPAPTRAEDQRLEDHQVKTQREVNTLPRGMGQSLGKTPATPLTDRAAEWKKTHPQKPWSTIRPQTQSPSPVPPYVCR